MIDRELETRVWQRIRGKETAEEDLEQLLRLCRMQREELRDLDRDLYRDMGAVLGLLNGLQIISAGPARLWGERDSRRVPRHQRIRSCRDRCGQMLALCIRLELHPRYGGVFTDLTRFLRAVCARLEQQLPAGG